MAGKEKLYGRGTCKITRVGVTSGKDFHIKMMANQLKPEVINGSFYTGY
jgi:hypothetical protein